MLPSILHSQDDKQLAILAGQSEYVHDPQGTTTLMEVHKMKLDYNCTGADRKKLVAAIADHLGQKAKYLGAPSFAYQVDCITIDKNGVLQLSDMADPDWVEGIEKHLADNGFECVSFAYDNPQPDPAQEEVTEDSSDTDISGICISMPRSLFTEQNLSNLRSIVEAKGNLIQKALGAADLPIEVNDTKVSFPWFPAEPTPDELKAYESFVCRLCDMARNQKRVTAKEKETDNEKYAFRCFLLRLGFIGDEFKVARKVLLKNFTGSSAFKSAPTAKEVRS